MRQIRHTLCFLCSFPLLWCMVACSSEDCPINNTVMGKMAFYSSYGEPVSFVGALTVRVARPQGDSVVLNKKANTSNLLFPLSYAHAVDTLILDYDGTLCDSIYIGHVNTPTLVSVDCGVAMYHTITSVSSTHYLIDSLILKSSDVDYDERENIQVLFPVAD